ncbi:MULTISPECIES: ribonuclease HII [Meridianimarinicoccus]|uniref:ribonuclease HII n=1 Tax=Meridianimarinicoccus zhengii TaxID=2056810 RepID=UPI002E269DE5|nr:ribonuclease HII [Phycocomes zhengii]
MARGLARVAGVDEVGRGPLAGPVTAAAVVLNPNRIPPGLNDSKKLTAARRVALAAILRETCDHCVVHVSPAEIDQLNILHASMAAMTRAVAGLHAPPDHVLVDGNRVPPALVGRAEAVVKGDARSLSISAASILAKVARDAVMADLARAYPGYGWERNVGYPTAEHRAALKTYGVTPHHRHSFAPVHNILCGGTS